MYVAVTFLPSVPGPRTGTLTVRDDAANPVQAIALSGMGIDFALQQDGPGSITVTSGGSVRYALLLDSPGAVVGNAALTCAGVPTNALCSVDPLVVPLGGGKVLVTVNVATGVKSAAAVLPQLPGSVPPAIWAVLALPLGWAVRRRRKFPLHLCALATAFLFLAGCGSGRTVPGNGITSPVAPAVTPPGTYTLTVAASSAGLVRAVSLILVVK